MIDSLNDHHIVCGFGRVGRQVARDLHAAGASFVVVDSDPENRQRAEALGVHFIEGDAADDAVLRAGRDRAGALDHRVRGLRRRTTCSSRSPRASCARTSRSWRGRPLEDTEKKLKRAGADRVISPYKASGTEMARLALHRQLSGVVDVDAEYRLEEIVVGRGLRGRSARRSATSAAAR